MSSICRKITLKNETNKIGVVRYQECSELIYINNSQILPNQTKTLWYITGTFSSAYLNDLIIVEDIPFPGTPEPTRTPTTTPTPTPTETPGVTSSETPTPTPTVTETPSVTQTPQVTSSPGSSPTPTLTQTPTITPTSDTNVLINPILVGLDQYLEVGNDEYLMFVDPTPSPTPTLTSTGVTTTPTPTPTNTPTETEIPITPSPTETPDSTPSGTTTPTPSVTFTATPGSSPTPTPTETEIPVTPSPTGTPDSTPSGTTTPTPSVTLTETPQVTATPGSSPTPTPTETEIPVTPSPTSGATAPFSVSFVESGSNILMSYSGTLDLTGLDFVQNTTSSSGGVGPALGAFGIGPSGALNISLYTGATFSYPSNFGTGGGGPSSVTGTGDYFGVFSGLYPTNTLVVPTGYTSGNFIQGTTTLSGSSFTSLGINTGNYNYSWGAGAGQSFVLTIGGVGPTPTPTSTSVTPTPTPSSGYTSGGWLFYSPDNQPVIDPPENDGNTTFIYSSSPNGTYNPNYTGGTFNLYFNLNNNLGTSYSTEFTNLDTSGGTLTISQGGSTAIYSGTGTNYQIITNFLRLEVTNLSQMVQSASTPFVSGTTINVTVN